MYWNVDGTESSFSTRYENSSITTRQEFVRPERTRRRRRIHRRRLDVAESVRDFLGEPVDVRVGSAFVGEVVDGVVVLVLFFEVLVHEARLTYSSPTVQKE